MRADHPVGQLLLKTRQMTDTEPEAASLASPAQGSETLHSFPNPAARYSYSFAVRHQSVALQTDASNLTATFVSLCSHLCASSALCVAAHHLPSFLVGHDLVSSASIARVRGFGGRIYHRIYCRVARSSRLAEGRDAS